MNKVPLMTRTSTGFGGTAVETLAERRYHRFATLRDIYGRNAPIGWRISARMKEESGAKRDPSGLARK